MKREARLSIRLLGRAFIIKDKGSILRSVVWPENTTLIF